MFFSETFLSAPYIIHFDPLSVLTANKTGFCLNKMFVERFIAQSVTRKCIKKKKKIQKNGSFFYFLFSGLTGNVRTSTCITVYRMSTEH